MTIYARQGIRLDRATLGNWSGRACFHLQPIADHMRQRLAMADRLFMDETTAPVLDPGRGHTKKGYFWAIVSDDRGHSGPSPPIVLFRYAPGRSGAFAEQFLDGFCGHFLQCDAYDAYDRLTEVARPQGPWTLVHCWSHLRRRFVKLARTSKSPIADAAVRHIAQLYAIEAMVRGSSPDIRLAARREHSLPIIAALKTWFEKQLSMISSGSTLAEDIRYALNHWQGLTRFFEDGRLELDTNPVENAIRPVCLTRKNALFAGHEIGTENWALLESPPIAPSTYHAQVAKRRDPARLSARARQDAALKIEVRRVFYQNFGVYGVRKVWRQLKREGFDVARCTVTRLMRDMGLQGVIRGKPVKTTISDKAAPCPLDHVNRQFKAPRPNVLWLSDFTYVATWTGFVYVAFVIDAYARRIVGWRAIAHGACRLRARCAGAGIA
ncbi:hypothetical protein ACVWZV_008992 [Bradyrhizobium sp. GM5.1]